VSPDSAGELADALDAVLSSTAEQKRWSEAGRARAQLFTWANAAERTLELYRSLGARGG